jgi:ParB family chromosome partitioning protein
LDRIPGIAMLPIEEIHVNPYQPRREFEDSALQELSHSIQQSGLIQPLIVRKVDKGFQLIAGERRLRASKLAGLKAVPVVVKKSTDKEALEMALVENIQRENLNCIEEALAYQQLMQDFHLTQEEVAGRVGKERATVTNFLRLLKLPAEIQRALSERKLSMGLAKVLLSVEGAEHQLDLYRKCLLHGWSVRALEAQVHGRTSEAKKPQKAQTPEPHPEAQGRLLKVADELTRALGHRVQFQGTEDSGKILLSYSSRAELDRLIELMQR